MPPRQHQAPNTRPPQVVKVVDLLDLKDAAIRYTDLLAKVTNSRQHDIGFMLYCPMGEGLRLAPEKRADYAKWLQEGAATLASLYNPDVGLIRSWPWGNHLVIIDNMMNLELLEWAAKNGGDAKYHDIAVSHARKTDENHFRADGGTYHVLDYDPNNGDWVTAVYSKQGANLVHSSWSRGQGWAIYGFTMMYRETKDPRFLVRAMKSADYAIDNPNMPADGVPYWDFGAPGEERDSSAAAVMASGLLELADFVGGEKGASYRAFAVKQLASLASSAYFSEGDEIGHFLLKHGVGHKPAHSEVDTPLDYGDYYFLEALLRLRDKAR